MARILQTFGSWGDVLTHAKAGKPLYYQAPMDRHASRIRVVKVFSNKKIRIDPMSNQADNFTADSGHLGRFLREP